MTKERKIAIKIWEDIKQGILNDTLTRRMFSENKADIARKYGVSSYAPDCIRWDNDCWFCQYVRRDYKRFGDFWEGTGKAKGLGEEGCNLCPLAKAHPLYDPSDAEHDCGCMLPNSPYRIARNIFHTNEERAAACDLIIKALKGEPITIEAEEEL